MPVLNPNHEVSQALDQVDTVRKLCAVLVMKLGGRVTITPDDLVDLAAMFGGGPPTLVTKSNSEDLELFLVSYHEGMRLAREEGGLP
jgi:hypothetical protein